MSRFSPDISLPTALPEHEPAALPIVEGRSAVVTQIADLTKTLSYMGEAHPQRVALRRRLAGLQHLLTRWDATLEVYASRERERP